MSSLSEQIAALIGTTSATTISTTDTEFNQGSNPLRADGTFALGDAAENSHMMLSDSKTTASGMDPKQLEMILAYIQGTGNYNQDVINQGYDSAMSSSGTLGTQNSLNQSALNQMGLLSGLNVDGQTMSAEERDALLMSQPGYQWQMEQGQRAAESSGAARGLLGSGALLKNLTTFGQGLAASNFSQYYGQLATLAGQTAGGASQYAQQQISRGTDLAKAASDTSNQYASALSTNGNKASVENSYVAVPDMYDTRVALAMRNAWK